mgnify:CR=1 FL=1
MKKLVIAPNLIGEEETSKKPNLSYDQINLWSDYVEKNPGKKIQELWVGFNKTHPKSGIDFISLQRDLDAVKQKSVGLAKKTGMMSKEETNTGYAFPKVVVDGKDYGRVNALMQTKIAPPVRKPAGRVNKLIPADAQDLFFDEVEQLPAYTNPKTGDIEYATRENLNNPIFKTKVVSKTPI